MSAVPARLRRNDPAVTRIEINLRNETTDAGDLAQALERNPFITAFCVNLEGVQTTDVEWGALLQVIATRANLESVTLKDAFNAEDRNAPPVLVSAVLQAIQQNTAIKSVILFSLRLPTDLSIFVDTASSVTYFILGSCDFAPAEREDGTRDLAAALQRNTNIQALHLIRSLIDVSMCSILQSLRANSSLKTIGLGETSFSDATIRAIQQLLESTTSIQAFDLVCSPFRGDEFRPVAQAIIGSKCMSKLKFYRCQFSADVGSVAHFQSILQNKQNLTGLHLIQCYFSGGNVHDTVMSALLQPNSPLRVFELKEQSLGDVIPAGQFQNLLQAVEKSKLERFVIGCIQSNQQLLSLADSIPQMRVKELTIGFDSYFEENIKYVLLQAVKNNFSLRSFRGECPGRDLFNDNEKARLVSYAERNECLDQWADNPETIDDRKVWPEALKLAERAGPNSLFRGLRSVLESDHVSSRSGRKRTRPQYFIPS